VDPDLRLILCTSGQRVDTMATPPQTAQEEEEFDVDVEVLHVTQLLAGLRTSGDAEIESPAAPETAQPPHGSYSPLRSRFPPHEGFATLPPDLQFMYHTPESIFRLLLTWEDVDDIVTNTNAYAAVHCRHEEWQRLTAHELWIWIGIVIYIGTHNVTKPRECWTEDPRLPVYAFTKFMTRDRFAQLRRYLHLSSLAGSDTRWFGQVEPLATRLRERFKRYYTPPTNVSVDEMMIRFSGRSAHTHRMNLKPTPEEYKVIALAAQGYCYTFEFVSRIEGAHVPRIDGLSATGSLVAALCEQLPANARQFNVFMDDVFSSIPLFSYLRSKGIGACGTVRSNSARYPKGMQLRGTKFKLDWNTIKTKEVGDVLVVCWIDDGAVQLLTTVHRVQGDEWFVVRNRRRPRETSTNAATVRRVFGGDSRKELAIPKIIDDYNHFVNRVGVADQYRSYYSLELISSRTWLPLFYWLLDTALTNSYIIFKKVHTDKAMTLKDFRMHVAWSLLNAGVLGDAAGTWKRSRRSLDSLDAPTRQPAVYVTSKTIDISPKRYLPGVHFPKLVDGRVRCLWCRFKHRTSGEMSSDAAGAQTAVVCAFCEVPLCFNKKRNCFQEFHEKQI
jgi:hypothetical protein